MKIDKRESRSKFLQLGVFISPAAPRQENKNQNIIFLYYVALLPVFITFLIVTAQAPFR